MDDILIGKVATTHGIKGELKLLSDFPYKEKVFFIGNILIIDKKEYKITGYRKHKKFDMVIFEGYTDINDVEFLLRKNVYIKKEQLSLNNNEILDEELITYKVLTNKGKLGIIKEIFLASSSNKILRLFIDEKEILLPYNEEFVKKIDKEKKEITVELIGGMLDED